MKVKNAEGEMVEIPDDSLVSIVVDGETREVPLSQLQADAQKVAGADKRFQEAAEKLKAAEEGSSDLKTRAEKLAKIESLTEKIRGGNGTKEDFVEYATLVGNDPTEAGQQWDAIMNQEETEEVEQTTTDVTALEKKIADLEAKLNSTSNYVRVDASDKANAMLKQAVASNRILSDDKFKSQEGFVNSLVNQQALDLLAADPNAEVTEALMAKAADEVSKKFVGLGVAVTPRTKEEYVAERMKTVNLGPAAEAVKAQEQKKPIASSADGGMEDLKSRFEELVAEHEYSSPDSMV